MAGERDPISAYLLIFVLEVFFIFVKNNPKIKNLNIFKHEDDTTFFRKDRNSIIELMSELNTFSKFSALKRNKKKCEILGIGVLNGVQVALYGMKCVNFDNEMVKILGFHLSYNKTLEKDKIFCENIVKIENVLNL